MFFFFPLETYDALSERGIESFNEQQFVIDLKYLTQTFGHLGTWFKSEVLQILSN